MLERAGTFLTTLVPFFNTRLGYPLDPLTDFYTLDMKLHKEAGSLEF